jgi:glyoxylase-like metal-dependent hydrolase (beta-lactamase superfamily II)
MSLPIANPWFSVETMPHGIVMLSEPHVARLWRANMFLVRGRTRDLLVDTGMGIGPLRATLSGLTDRTPIVFTTHNHLDHIGGHAEFGDAEILIHADERAGLAAPGGPTGLAYASMSAGWIAGLAAAGFDTVGLMVDAIPRAGYDVADHHFRGVEATRAVGEGEVLDLGDRAWQVLHLPGHSPGSLALWEPATGTLIAGDAIYDGVLVDTLEGSDIPIYIRTMERLRALPVATVHGGHRRPFGRARMIEIIDGYIASRADGRTPAPDHPPISF